MTKQQRREAAMFGRQRGLYILSKRGAWVCDSPQPGFLPRCLKFPRASASLAKLRLAEPRSRNCAHSYRRLAFPIFSFATLRLCCSFLSVKPRMKADRTVAVLFLSCLALLFVSTVHAEKNEKRPSLDLSGEWEFKLDPLDVGRT